MFFVAKLEHCAKTPAHQCSSAYDRWQSQAREALDEPGRVVANCHESLRVRSLGLAGVQDIEQRQIPAAERLAAQRRSEYEAAQARVQKLSASAQPCGAN